MGAYLSTPITVKDSSEGESSTLKYGLCSMQGWRTEMEDAHTAVLEVDADAQTGFFAVFDGHGGQEVAKYCALHMVEELVQLQSYKDGNLGQALSEVYLHIDSILATEEKKPELENLASKEQGSGRMPVDEDELPEMLREAIQKARNRAAQDDSDSDESGSEGDNQLDSPSDEELAENVMSELFEDVHQETEGLDNEPDEAPPGSSKAEREAARQSKRKRNLSGSTTGHASSDVAEPLASEFDQLAAEGEPESSSSEAASEEAAGPHPYLGPSAGCTAVVALVRGDKLYVANAGDSRCVASHNGHAVALTHDHKPTDAPEHDRIMKAGGFIAEGRVNGSLNLSRALGDMEYKQSKDKPPGEQMVTALPDLRTLALEPGHEFLLLACDGIWDVLTNQEAVTFVRKRLADGQSPRHVCEELCDQCLAPNTAGDGKGCDNMSAMVVLLKSFAAPAKGTTASVASLAPVDK